MNNAVTLQTRTIVWAVGAIVVLLIAASLIGQIYILTGGHERYAVEIFNLDAEHNVPTWFSAFILLLSAQLALWIALVERSHARGYRTWIVVAVLLLYLAMDEVLQFHEQWNGVMARLIDPQYFPWIWLYGSAIVLLGVIFIPFLRRLPRRTAVLMVAAGVIYVLGAAGLELVNVPHRAVYGKDTIYVLLQTLEEAMEMAGVLLLIYALLDFLRNYGPVSIQLR